MKTNDLARLIGKAAEEIKALDLVILDLAGLTSFTDFFVICSATSDTQARAIASNIQKKMKEAGHAILGLEGMEKGDWVLIDFGEVVAHVFHQNVREYYSLEKLWSDASISTASILAKKVLLA